METLEQISKRINQTLKDKNNEPDMDKEYFIYNALRYLLDDALKMIKNINETSLPGHDRTQRIIDLEKKFGIPKTHIL